MNFNPTANAIASRDVVGFPKFSTVEINHVFNADIVDGTVLFERAINPEFPFRDFYCHLNVPGTTNLYIFWNEFYFNGDLVSRFPIYDRGTGATANLYRLRPFAANAGSTSDNDQMDFALLGSTTTIKMTPFRLYVRADTYKCRAELIRTNGQTTTLFVHIRSKMQEFN